MSLRAIREKWHRSVVPKCANRTKRGQKCEFCANPNDASVTLDCDMIGQIVPIRGRKSDCIIFVQKKKMWAGVAELKSNNYDLGQVVGQLEAGCALALKILEGSGDIKNHEIVPILVAKSHSRSKHRLMRQVTIRVGGRRYCVTTARCSGVFACK